MHILQTFAINSPYTSQNVSRHTFGRALNKRPSVEGDTDLSQVNRK